MKMAFGNQKPPFFSGASRKASYHVCSINNTPYFPLLGNEAGVSQAWEDTVRKAGQSADSLQACSMPHGSRGRVALAQSKLMGKAFATLRLTVPSDQATQ